MVSVTVTENTMTVIADEEIADTQWLNIIYGHGLQDRVMDVVDYSIDDYDVEVPVHTWRFHFATADVVVG